VEQEHEQGGRQMSHVDDDSRGHPVGSNPTAVACAMGAQRGPCEAMGPLQKRACWGLLALVALLPAGLSLAAEVGGQSAPSPSLTTLDEMPEGERWIFIDKSDRSMVVSGRAGYLETFSVALGWVPVGDKEVEGDGRTPEGELYVCHRIRGDRFHRFLGLSYPMPEDAERGRLAGLILPSEVRAILRAGRRHLRPPWNTRLGGNVGIHGMGTRAHLLEAHGVQDWTDGCIGVTNDEIDRIFDHTRMGTRVVIVP